MDARTCQCCNQRLDGSYVRCSACKNAFYCTVDCQRKNWDIHSKECTPALKVPAEFKRHVPIPSNAPRHNLEDLEIDTVRETSMMEDFYKWRNVWYKTIVKCVIAMLSCEPYGLEKLKTHGLAIWVGERADFAGLENSKAELQERLANRQGQWDVDQWEQATQFKIEYIRLVPWEQLTSMLECFPLEETFLNSFRTICPPDKLRIVAFLAPTLLSYDTAETGYRGLPPPRWTFPSTTELSSDVQDLITRTMPFFEPLVTAYRTSGTTDAEDKARFAQLSADGWEWVIKKVVELGWYSKDGRAWREFVDKMACKNCRGPVVLPGEVRTGLTYMAKVDEGTRKHKCLSME